MPVRKPSWSLGRINKGLLLRSRNNKRGITHTNVCMFVVGMPFRKKTRPVVPEEMGLPRIARLDQGAWDVRQEVLAVEAVVGLMMCENPVGLPHQISQLQFLCYATADPIPLLRSDVHWIIKL